MPDLFAGVARLPGVDEAVAEARAAVDRLLTHRILRRRSAEVSAEIALRDARASAALEGADIALERLRAILTTGDEPPPLVTGAVRVSAELGSLTPIWTLAPRQALARLHLLAVPDEGSAVGRPRAGGSADDPLGLGPAPSPAEVGARLELLSGALVGASTAPAVVVAAVVHGELLVLRPFGVADGIVARAAARLVLAERGLDAKGVTAPDVGSLEQGGLAGYATAASAYAAGDVVGWVRHCAAAVALGAREGLAVCEAMARAD